MSYELGAGDKISILQTLNLLNLRLASLLAQFLYTHKRLELPGLGIFLLHEHYPSESDGSRHQKNQPSESISFENKPSVAVSPELIQFISSQTGKIKALASADLESHLELAQQFLNIGKPFVFEGIGTMVKIRSNEFEFIPGSVSQEIKKEQPTKEIQTSAATEEYPTDYKSVFYPAKPKTKWKKPVAVILLVAGLAVAIWGGYTVYKRTTGKKQATADKEVEKEEIPAKDSLTPVTTDTTKTTTPLVTIPPGNYKFVLETSPAEKAIVRYNKLKTFQWDVQLETKDSTAFKIYMILPASATDTTRLRDSLSLLTGKRVRIE